MIVANALSFINLIFALAVIGCIVLGIASSVIIDSDAPDPPFLSELDNEPFD